MHISYLGFLKSIYQYQAIRKYLMYSMWLDFM